MITLLHMGQSNAQGRGGGGDCSFSDKVKVWNNHNYRIDLQHLGDAFIHPDINYPPFVDRANNMAVHAANKIANDTGQDVRLIIVASSGKNINYWHPETGDVYARVKAVLSEAGVSKVDAILWHQGESDDPTYTLYADKFLNVMSGFEADGIIESNTPIVLGEVAPDSGTNINYVLHSLVDHRTSIASTKHLPLKDPFHFSGEGLVMAGHMYGTILIGELGLRRYGNYVVAEPSTALVLSNGVDTVIDLSASGGDDGLIDGGAFIARYDGDYEFTCRGHGVKGVVRLKLLDESGNELALVAYTGVHSDQENNPIISGVSSLRLKSGYKVKFAINQYSGADRSMSHGSAKRFCGVTVKRLT